MRPTPAYYRPTSVGEAVDALASNEGSVALAGGTDLMNDMRLGLMSPGLVVDTDDLTAFQVFDLTAGAVMGAGTTMRALLEHEDARQRYPALREAATLLGGRQMQAVATVGGNLCHASPAAETATPLLVYDTVAVVTGATGRREIPLGEFWEGPRRSCLQRGDLLVELRIPPGAEGTHSAYRRLELRQSVDIAIVSASTCLHVADGAVADARVAIGAVAPTPLRVTAAEDALRGVDVADEARLTAAIAEAADACRAASSPIDDTRASRNYRSAMLAVVVQRCMKAALSRPGPDPMS